MLTIKLADRFFIQLVCVTVEYSSKSCVTGEILIDAQCFNLDTNVGRRFDWVLAQCGKF